VIVIVTTAMRGIGTTRNEDEYTLSAVLEAGPEADLGTDLGTDPETDPETDPGAAIESHPRPWQPGLEHIAPRQDQRIMPRMSREMIRMHRTIVVRDLRERGHPLIPKPWRINYVSNCSASVC
jgi:hypothetical protein